uniref:Uncharacterized protein n=1 Tax=Anguilla anguilla TaxID=7936 RepID=A0A0E9SC15_ANGAN
MVATAAVFGRLCFSLFYSIMLTHHSLTHSYLWAI